MPPFSLFLSQSVQHHHFNNEFRFQTMNGRESIQSNSHADEHVHEIGLWPGERLTKGRIFF